LVPEGGPKLKDFSHIDGEGRVRMVDVSGKPVSRRTAVARGSISMSPDTVVKLREGAMKKGDALATAKIAGITAAKRTSDLIPLCHPLPIDDISVDLELLEDRVGIEASVTCTARTGIEMEALTAVSVAALTLYDMCKAADSEMSIGEIRLVSKKKEEI
jgi:cyclic pyranopterin phosphate synthase